MSRNRCFLFVLVSFMLTLLAMPAIAHEGAHGDAHGDAAVEEPRPLVPMACFAEGSDPKLVEEAHVRFWESRLRTSVDPPGLDGLQKFTFSDDSRWTTTATDGGGLSQGDPMTLTWSIVPDGTSIFGYNGEPTNDSDLRAFLDGIYGSSAVWLPIFEGVFARWSELTGINYVYEPNDDGSAWTQTNILAGQLGVRGDVRISGHLIDGPSGVLAYNFFPNFGDMVIDTADTTYNNTANSSLVLRNILAHEHGHGIGISHVCPVNQTKLMEPFLATAFDGPQFDDILAGQRGYGDTNENNDSSGTATDLGTIDFAMMSMIDTVSVDDNSDTDFYAFTVDGATTLDVTLLPSGSTYLSGPQNANGSCSPGSNFNTLDNQDLALEVLDTDGSSVLASVDDNGAEGGESVSGLSLPAAGTYYVQISGPNNEAQLYDLTLEVGKAASPLIFEDGFETGNTLAWDNTVP